VLPLVTPPPPVRLRLRLLLHRRLSLRLSCASCPADCRVDSRHAAAFRPPAPLPLIAPQPLTTPLLCLLSSWLSHHFSSCRHLLSACASASHRTPPVPLVWLIVALTLIMPPPSNHLRLCLSSHCCLSLHASCASFPAGCCVTSRHAAASRPPALCLSLHFASHRAPLAPLVWLVVTSPLVMPLPPVSLCPCLSVHCRLSLRPSCNHVYNADGRGDGQGDSRGNG
jgi:hypothetical protein